MSDYTVPQNLKILGDSSSGGGSFLHVKITGDGHFHDSVICRRLSLTGNAKVKGNLQAEKMRITGELAAADTLSGQSLRGTGEIKAGAVRMEEMDFNGSLVAAGDCEGGKLHIKGAVQIDGLLSADELEISLYGSSRAKEVGGGTITIKRSKAGKLLNLLKMNPAGAVFTAGLIEGDTVELHATAADTVRGEHVIIGPDCTIRRIEYRNSLEIHNLAAVQEQVKLL